MYRMYLMDATEEVCWMTSKIKRSNIPASPINDPLIQIRLQFARKKPRRMICVDNRCIDILSCITYKHTPTFTQQKHRHIIHTVWAALRVNFSSLLPTIQCGRRRTGREKKHKIGHGHHHFSLLHTCANLNYCLSAENSLCTQSLTSNI